MFRAICLTFCILGIFPLSRSAAGSEIADESPHSASEPLLIEPELVHVPAGLFVMGGDGFPYDTPRRVRRVEEFYLGKYEVTEAEFIRFYNYLQICPEYDPTVSGYVEEWREGNYQGDGRLPASGVRWSMANAYAEWLAGMTGKPYRLPSEIEWEFVASGPEKRVWPWGMEYDRENFNGLGVHGRDTFDFLSPVGHFPSGATPLGIHDMSGNVIEWCSNRFVTFEDPKGGEWLSHAALRVARGGYATGGAIPVDQTTRHRERHPLNSYSPTTGFRIAMDFQHEAESDGQGADQDPDHAVLSLVRKAKRALSTVPVGSESRPWVLLHALLAFGYRESLPDADNYGEGFLPLEALTFEHSFSPPEDESRRLFRVTEDGILPQEGRMPNFLEDHEGQSLFVFSQIELPEFYTLSIGPRGAFSVFDALSSVLRETHGFEDLSWTLPALAYYRGEWCKFTNRFGEELRLSALLERFMERFNDRRDRPCFGTHYHYCLAYLAWYDRYLPIMDDEGRRSLRLELDTASRNDLAAIATEVQELPPSLKDLELIDLLRYVHSIGHRLEWLSMWSLSDGGERSALDPYFEPLVALLEEGASRIHRGDQEPFLYGSMCHAVHATELAARTATNPSGVSAVYGDR